MRHARHANHCTRRTRNTLAVVAVIMIVIRTAHVSDAVTLSGAWDKISYVAGITVVIAALVVGARVAILDARHRTDIAEQHSAELEAAKRDNELARYRAQREAARLRGELVELRARLDQFDGEAAAERAAEEASWWDDAVTTDGPTIAWDTTVVPLIHRRRSA